MIIVAGCKNISKPNLLLKDSLLQAHIHLADSLEFYDTTNYDYKILKAYANDDSIFFNKMKEDLELNRKRTDLFPFDSCVHIKKLSELEVEDVYRFRHSQSFCNFYQIITISRKGKSFDLHYVEYGNGEGHRITIVKNKKDTIVVKPYCTIVKDFHNALAQKDWDTLDMKINAADYWGLKTREERLGLDGSDWTIEAYTKTPRYYSNQQTHKVYRWSPTNEAFQELGVYFIRLSGVKTMCGDIF